jgi:hypothetical protein
MNISADKNSPDYHDVVHFIDQITIDGTVVKSVISVDTVAGCAVCYSQPLKIENGYVMTHLVLGKIDIIWRAGGGTLFLYLKKDWEEREELRKQAKGSSCIYNTNKTS